MSSILRAASHLMARKVLAPRLHRQPAIRMLSIPKAVSRLITRKPLAPRVYSNTNYERIDAHVTIDEETEPNYIMSNFYPVRTGEIFQERFQVVGKLGYGSSSTVWLARNLINHDHVTLKVFQRSRALKENVPRELGIYQRLAAGRRDHPGRKAVRELLDTFIIPGPDGEHDRFVHRPLWDNVYGFLEQNPTWRLPTPALGILLQQVFLALDHLHTECRIIHTDINCENIMYGPNQTSVLEKFETEEHTNPIPRKEADGRTIYMTRELTMPSENGLGPPILCDFGSAVYGDQEHTENAQPQ